MDNEEYDKKVQKKLNKFLNKLHKFINTCADYDIVVYWNEYDKIIDDKIINAIANHDIIIGSANIELEILNLDYLGSIHKFNLVNNIGDLLIMKSTVFFEQYVRKNFYLLKKLKHHSREYTCLLDQMLNTTIYLCKEDKLKEDKLNET